MCLRRKQPTIFLRSWRACAPAADVVIERNAEAVAGFRPAAPNVRLLSESLGKGARLDTTLEGEFGRDLE